MKVKEMPIGELVPYENNPRRNENAVDPVAQSIKKFGFQQPIVVDKDNVVIVGHTRLLAAKELGLSSVPVVVADWLTEDEVKAYRLADNKTGELAGWDFGLLEIELDDINLSMEPFGFSGEDNLDLDGMFSEPSDEEKEPKTILCPSCGEVIEL